MEKILLTCGDCRFELPISPKNLRDKETLECFNCGKKMDEKLLNPLKNMANSHVEATANCSFKSSTGSQVTEWSFEFSND